MNTNKLPADPAAMVLGVIALIFTLAGCCCGIFAFIPLILSIIGLVMARKSLTAYRNNSELYDPQSKSNVYTAQVLNIIALVVSTLVTLAYVAYFAIYGVMFSEIIMEAYEHRSDNGEFNFEWGNDSIYNQNGWNLERDTISIDSIRINESDILDKNKPLDTIN